MLAERGRGAGRFFTLRVSADRGNLTKTVLRYTVSQHSCKDRAWGWPRFEAEHRGARRCLEGTARAL